MEKAFVRSCGRVSKRIVECLTKPFSDELPFLLVVLLLISVPAMYFYIKIHCLVYAFYVLLASACLSYVIALLISVLPKRLAKVIRIVLFVIIGIHLILDLFCVVQFQSCLNADFIAALLGTNLNEATEFLDTFVDLETIAMLASSFIACGLLVWMVKRVKLSAIVKRACFGVVCVSAALCVRNNSVWQDTILGHLSITVSAENAPNLRQYYTSPALMQMSKEHPQNIAVIIGEAFSRSHSSLFGYDKMTSPQLAALRDSDMLFTYDSVESPALNTIPAFKRFMSTWKPSVKPQVNEEEWYKFTTIPEIVSLCGYASYWISNQSKHGLFDNVVGKYADLCDSQFFVGQKFAGIQRKTYDEEVLPLIKGVQRSKEASRRTNFYFIHLMGSHEVFESRYPANRNHFKESEYAKYPMNQRKNRAAYDNSILYNDSVVNEIIKLFEDKEAIIIYFSDHALDVYQSSNDYCAHAKATNPASVAAGKAIPFMVYASRMYQRRFPEMMKRIKSSVDETFSTDDLIYTVMDVIGVKFARNDDVERYSLFR